MATRTVTVGSTVGLHARPAAIIAEKAGEFDADINLSVVGEDEEPVDAASAMLIMTLGAENGAQVIVESDDAAAVDAIADLIEQNLDA